MNSLFKIGDPVRVRGEEDIRTVRNVYVYYQGAGGEKTLSQFHAITQEPCLILVGFVDGGFSKQEHLTIAKPPYHVRTPAGHVLGLFVDEESAINAARDWVESRPGDAAAEIHVYKKVVTVRRTAPELQEIRE